MKLLRYMGYIFLMLLAMVSVGASTVFFVLYFLSSELPDHNSLKKYSPDLSSRVFLRDGSKLCEYASEKRYFVPVDKIPKKLINAFLSVEDKHFFEHPGIDFYGVVRSMIKNLENLGTGKRPQGASTITQQVARIFLIKNNELSYIRKIKEAILSYRIENSLSKMQILELYLNQIYLGLGSYGVAAAAKTYFNKALDELTIAECSYLAALAKGAGNYHPIRRKDRAIVRRNWAVGRQLEDGRITETEAKESIREELKIAEQTPSSETAEYFSEEIRKYLIDKFPFESLNKEGLIVRTTLDAKLQRCAYFALRKGIEEADRRFGWRGPVAEIDARQSREEILKELLAVSVPKGMEEFLRAAVISHENKKATLVTEKNEVGKILDADVQWAKKLKLGNVIFVSKLESGKNKGQFSIRQLPRVQGALVVVEVNSGRVLAMQGGYSFSQSEFNRATQAMRQTGSAFKPFVYLAGLENGFSPNSIIDASPVEIDLGEGLGIWKPRNYHGTVLDKITFRGAIEKSVNTATIRIAQEIGVDKIARIAEQFCIFDSMPELLSYALGAGETTLLKLTTAYAMLSNGGKRISPTMVEYIQDKHGKVMYKIDERIVGGAGYDVELPPKLNDNRQQILSEQSVYQLTSLLEGVMQRGSGASASFLNFPIAGKTGTSNDSRDAWFIGYTPDIAVGVFVGFDDHSQSLGKNANGSNTALPIFIDFMVEAKKYLTPKPFKVPKGIKLRKIDAETGAIPSADSRRIIVEAFKEDDDENFEQPNLIKEKNSIMKLLDDKKINSSDTTRPIMGIY
ncbi:MAG: PBP1A family penicillin-binding protein [Holosporaceae bacterium]|jgi:penicillin-binding protein 1A|nr:PBP1A family penicillin-binding protein [Holosporaceae bacterium]